VKPEPSSDAIADYRPVSRLAVTALVAGCASTLAVITRFAWAVPLVGTTLAMAALIDVARPESRKAGRVVALAALALSVGFGAQAVTSLLVDRWIMAGRATAVAGAWIDAVRAGRLPEALGFCAAAVLSDPSLPRDLEPEALEAERLRRFAELPAVRASAGCSGGRPPITRAAAVGADDDAWTVEADLTPCGSPSTTLRLMVMPKRVRGTDGPAEQWRVVSLGVDR